MATETRYPWIPHDIIDALHHRNMCDDEGHPVEDQELLILGRKYFAQGYWLNNHKRGRVPASAVAWYTGSAETFDPHYNPGVLFVDVSCDTLLTTSLAADAANVHPRTIRNAIDSGNLHAKKVARINGHIWIIVRQELDDWLTNEKAHKPGPKLQIPSSLPSLPAAIVDWTLSS